MATPSEKFAYTVGKDMRGVEDRTKQILPADDSTFSVTDQAGAVALSVTASGSTTVGDAELLTVDPAFRVIDKDGFVALEVRPDGQVIIPDLTTSGRSSREIDTLHIFLAIGQSNMAGRGTPIEGPVTPRIKQWNATAGVVETAPLNLEMDDPQYEGTSPVTFFAESYVAAQPDRVGVLIVPAARGATGFWERNPETGFVDNYTWLNVEARSNAYELYRKAVEKTQDAILGAKTAGFQPVLKGILWHQGESNTHMDPETYQGYLDAMIADFRDDLGDPALPFVLGGLAPEGIAANPPRGHIQAVIEATPYRISRTGYAKPQPGTHKPGDTTHFSTIGVKALADTYIDGFIQALGNTGNREF